jgi:hypothetical protein
VAYNALDIANTLGQISIQVFYYSVLQHVVIGLLFFDRFSKSKGLSSSMLDHGKLRKHSSSIMQLY